MAESTPIEQRDPGAPIAPGQIDPELVKLARTRTKVGVVTALGIVVLAAVFLVRLGPDRRFAGASGAPTPVAVADVLAGKIEVDQLVSVGVEPMVSHAIRATNKQGSLGHRVVPARGTGDRLWLVLSGDGYAEPALTGTVGRLRKLDDLPLAEATRAWAAGHPRPVFTTAAAIRQGLTAGTVTTVSGDVVKPADGDAVALDLVDPNAAEIAASLNERLPDAGAWRAALDKAGIAPTTTGTPDPSLGQVRFQVTAPVAEVTAKLEAARLFAARVEPVTRHHQTTWGALRRSPAAGLDLGGTTVPDAQLGLVGLYVARDIPGDAYAVVTGERPDDYWYVMPITVALAVILLVFAWALARAIRRDLLPARPA